VNVIVWRLRSGSALFINPYVSYSTYLAVNSVPKSIPVASYQFLPPTRLVSTTRKVSRSVIMPEPPTKKAKVSHMRTFE
jgi:hypothetical protein